MHFYCYTICINVLDTSTKTNCSLVQREEHSNVCKTLQAAIRDGLPETTFGFSDLSWHKGQYSPAPSLPSCSGSPTACGHPHALRKGTAPVPSQGHSLGQTALLVRMTLTLLAELMAFVYPSEDLITIHKVYYIPYYKLLCIPSVQLMLTETQICFTLILIVKVTKIPRTKVQIKSYNSKFAGIKTEGKTEFDIQQHTVFYMYTSH